MIVTPVYEEKYKYVYIDSTNKNTILKYFLTQFPYTSKTNLKLYVNTDIQNYLDKYGPDSLFMRMSSHSTDFIFNVFYVYGLKEKYILYIKKHFGKIDFYEYNGELNAFTNITKFQMPYFYYLNEFNLIKDNFLNISGFQLYTFHNSYNSLIDFYLQKEEDSENIILIQKCLNLII